MTSLAKYLLVFFQSTVPVADHSYYEKVEVTQARYESIADTVASVAMEHPLFRDDTNGVKTALLLGSVATFESSLIAEIDTCVKGGDIDKAGVPHAWTLWQVHAPKETACANRLAGARIAREMIRWSFKTCSSFDVSDRLSGYTDGSCKNKWNRSRHRMFRATNWLEKHPFAAEDYNEKLYEIPYSLHDYRSDDGSCHFRNRHLGISPLRSSDNCID
jgi:hypothetical protein